MSSIPALKINVPTIPQLAKSYDSKSERIERIGKIAQGCVLAVGAVFTTTACAIFTIMAVSFNADLASQLKLNAFLLTLGTALTYTASKIAQFAAKRLAGYFIKITTEEKLAKIQDTLRFELVDNKPTKKLSRMWDEVKQQTTWKNARIILVEMQTIAKHLKQNAMAAEPLGDDYATYRQEAEDFEKSLQSLIEEYDAESKNPMFNFSDRFRKELNFPMTFADAIGKLDLKTL